MKGKKVRYEDISYILQYKEKHFLKNGSVIIIYRQKTMRDIVFMVK